MNKTIKILAIIAVVQLVLTALTWMGGTELKGQTDRSTLLTFNQAEIDRIVIKAGESETTLIKKESQWQIADSFPADQSKVGNLLEKLEALKYGLPVATSKQALERFKVADDDFERRIQLQKNGDTVGDMYLGSGAGARQSHARNSDQKAVYTVNMGTYDVSADVSEWQDKTLLQLKKGSITKVELNDLKLELDPESGEKDAISIWKADALAENKLLNQKVINESLDKLQSLRFDKVLGKESKPEYGMDKALLTLSLVHKAVAKEGQPEAKREYQFGKLKGSEDYVLKVSDREEYFQIASYNGKSIVENITGDKWLMDKPAPKPAKPVASPATSKTEQPEVETSQQETQEAINVEVN